MQFKENVNNNLTELTAVLLKIACQFPGKYNFSTYGFVSFTSQLYSILALLITFRQDGNLERKKKYARENVQGERDKDGTEMPKMNQAVIIQRFLCFRHFIKSQLIHLKHLFLPQQLHIDQV